MLFCHQMNNEETSKPEKDHTDKQPSSLNEMCFLFFDRYNRGDKVALVQLTF